MTQLKQSFSENYCVLPFMHLATTPTDEILPCCSWDKTSVPSPLRLTDADPFNSPWMSEIRQHMLDDLLHPGCKACKSYEKLTGSSTRISQNSRWGFNTEIKLRYIEYNLGNLCNLKCRMCSGKNSTSWHKDEQELGWRKHPVVRRLTEHRSFPLDAIEWIRFIGGEPLLEQEAICQILSDIKSAKKDGLTRVGINITTNVTIRMSDALTRLLSECKDVVFFLSIDGYGKHNDYQRTGSCWDETADNLIYFDQLSLGDTVKRYIDPTLTLLTLNSMMDFDAWVYNNLKQTIITGRIVVHPVEFRICNIPREYKTRLIDRFSNWSPMGQGRFTNTCKNLILSDLKRDNQCSIQEIQTRISVLDKIRGENFSEIDAEMYEALFEQRLV